MSDFDVISIPGQDGVVMVVPRLVIGPDVPMPPVCKDERSRELLALKYGGFERVPAAESPRARHMRYIDELEQLLKRHHEQGHSCPEDEARSKWLVERLYEAGLFNGLIKVEDAMSEWTTTHRAYFGGGYRYSLATDGDRWRWTVHCRGELVAQAMALNVNGARDDAKQWIDQRIEEVRG